jgi:hypothetical protein
VDKMLADSAFNHFDKADWTVLGPMSDATVAAYQLHLAQDIPPDLERLVTAKGQNLAYLRRGVTNVVFSLDLALGVNPARADRRAAIEAERQEEAREEQPVVRVPGTTSLSAPARLPVKLQRRAMRPLGAENATEGASAQTGPQNRLAGPR